MPSLSDLEIGKLAELARALPHWQVVTGMVVLLVVQVTALGGGASS